MILCQPSGLCLCHNNENVIFNFINISEVCKCFSLDWSINRYRKSVAVFLLFFLIRNKNKLLLLLPDDSFYYANRSRWRHWGISLFNHNKYPHVTIHLRSFNKYTIFCSIESSKCAVVAFKLFFFYLLILKDIMSYLFYLVYK